MANQLKKHWKQNVCEKLSHHQMVDRPCGILGDFLTYGMNINHIKGNRTFVLMHSGNLNGYYLLCDAHTVLEPHTVEELQLFSILLAIVLFHFFFLCVCHS